MTGQAHDLKERGRKKTHVRDLAGHSDCGDCKGCRTGGKNEVLGSTDQQRAEHTGGWGPEKKEVTARAPEFTHERDNLFRMRSRPSIGLEQMPGSVS